MVSRRYRDKSSVGTRLNRLQSEVLTAKREHLVITERDLEENSVSSFALQPKSIGPEHLQRGAVGTENLGVINEITTDTGLALVLPDGSRAYLGNSITDGSFFDLGTSDLDNITTTGAYIQSTVVNGTLARHYPYASAAGLLEVFNWGGNHIYQRFTRRGDAPIAQVFIRGKYTTGAWQAWTVVQGGPDTGWVSTGLWTAASGWSVTGYQARKVGNSVKLRFINFTRTGTALNGAAGDIGNALVTANLSDTSWAPGVGTFQLYAGNSGRTVTGYIDGNGAIGVSAIAAALADSTGVIPTNAVLSLSGDWYLD